MDVFIRALNSTGVDCMGEFEPKPPKVVRSQKIIACFFGKTDITAALKDRESSC